jgi:hypothetical protein
LLGKSDAPSTVLHGSQRRVWRWFCDLNEVRSYPRLVEPKTDARGTAVWKTQIRAERLSYGEVQAWARMSGIVCEPWQIAAISLLDEIYVDTFNDPRPRIERAVGQLTPQIFSALFGNK